MCTPTSCGRTSGTRSGRFAGRPGAGFAALLTVATGLAFAQSADILRMVLRQGARLAGAGVLLGVGIALAAGRSMQALLAGVSPADAPTFGVAVGLSLAMALVGSLVPALRAMRLDPLTVMRAE